MYYQENYCHKSVFLGLEDQCIDASGNSIKCTLGVDEINDGYIDDLTMSVWPPLNDALY